MVKKVILISLLILLIASFLRIAFMSGIDADEIEHIHISWLLGKGVLPYKDIHQIHMPLLWILSTPIIKLLPESSFTLLFFRGLSVLLFVFTIWIGYKILILFTKFKNGDFVYYYLILMFSLAILVEFYKFRPDIFMSFFALTGVYYLIKYQNNKIRNIFMSGIFLGVALSFSLKIFPILFLYPLTALKIIKNKKNRSIKCFCLNIFHFAGVILGIIPSFLWIFYKRLFRNFYQWVIKNNFEMKKSFITQTNMRYILGFIILSVFIILLYNKIIQDKKYEVLLISLILTYSVRMADPNHLIYNWQIMIIILSLILSILLYNLNISDESFNNFFKKSVIILLLIIVSFPPIFISYKLSTVSWNIKAKKIDTLLYLKGGKDNGCVGFAPYHPVFCYDSTPLYLTWDYYFIVKDWISDKGKDVYKKMWNKAIEKILESEPKIIVSPVFFKLSYENKIINNRQFSSLYRLFKRRYKKVMIEDLLVLIRK